MIATTSARPTVGTGLTGEPIIEAQEVSRVLADMGPSHAHSSPAAGRRYPALRVARPVLATPK
jgi:hypothetical protein